MPFSSLDIYEFILFPLIRVVLREGHMSLPLVMTAGQSR